jgi:hypothetical protein
MRTNGFFPGGNGRSFGQSPDLVNVSCLKAGCPGRSQPSTCRVLRSTRECATPLAAGLGHAPRTSAAAWWLT